MGVYEKDKGTRELEGWRGRSKTLQRVKEGKNQTVKNRQREVATEKYKNGTKRGQGGGKRDGVRQSQEWGRRGWAAGLLPCEGDSVEIKISI